MEELTAKPRYCETCGKEILGTTLYIKGKTYCAFCASKSKNIKQIICPQCKKEFILTWDDYTNKPQTLFFNGCPSGGIYNVFIRCPHCDYEEEL